MVLNKKDAEFLENTKKQFKEKYPNKTDKEIEHLVLDMLFEAYSEGVIDRHGLIVLTEGLGYKVIYEAPEQVKKEKKQRQYYVKGGKVYVKN